MTSVLKCDWISDFPDTCYAEKYNWGCELPDTCYADIELCASVFVLAWCKSKNKKIECENFMNNEIFKEHISWITSGTALEQEQKLKIMLFSLKEKLRILKSCEKYLEVKVSKPRSYIYNMDSIAFAMYVDINYQEEPYCDDEGYISNDFEFIQRGYTMNKEGVLSSIEYSYMIRRSVIIMERLIKEVEEREPIYE